MGWHEWKMCDCCTKTLQQHSDCFCPNLHTDADALNNKGEATRLHLRYLGAGNDIKRPHMNFGSNAFGTHYDVNHGDGHSNAHVTCPSILQPSLSVPSPTCLLAHCTLHQLAMKCLTMAITAAKAVAGSPRTG